ncbi:VIT1/CCC1 transporter family protein [Microlunatus parietis]|uniref:VIT1/CCC1 family predicted Fe2+/Mn2+ transporter n=1 Tax=Microlunatus parietis TaxID=682979 RepID=A0A7Y9I458_9ACTN|nr:VIT family protein [Microlunatus parietis]NYE69696.1 VIT1/CCC1 family predicted Fe2+/Mn2+ transporter [Microlunatus parietis]
MTDSTVPKDVADHDEPHGQGLQQKLNWLRAGVLGANDGIVSTAALVVGVAGATTDRGAVGIAGLAGLIAGALSMAAGEYVSVSTQRDTERALIAKERDELRTMPEQELAELTQLYRDKGLSPDLARQVAVELTEKDALKAHLDVELNLDADDVANPWTAAIASAISFSVGALLPLLAILLSPELIRVPVTFAAVVLALALTGVISSKLGGAATSRAVIRNVLGGALAMIITYVVGRLVGGV